MLPLSDLQSLNEYIILRKMSEFKCSYGVFNIIPFLMVNRTLITPPPKKKNYHELIMVLAD